MHELIDEFMHKFVDEFVYEYWGGGQIFDRIIALRSLLSIMALALKKIFISKVPIENIFEKYWV
jgi:hypothetical protein